MPSVKRWITAAGQDSAPNTGLVKTSRSVGAMHASIALCLVAAQILAGGFVAVQPMVSEWHSFWTNKCVSLQIVRKAVLFREIGELNSRNISCNVQQFQAAINSAGSMALQDRK